ncbi:hypothetical protein ASG29_06540 [Sphingomonas sp. Leaf412]|uniref:hypothetical protein n=1 Tax=Sphingomonas sp. Leaf412 TaxID=1736370 RepID=UPI0006FB91AC|nr:hypothetical protein [Sphingomonas sp. Leaf412]KQT33664.1 hypothetical protein ASG29_06540 [Sphingomonas sp. Leaf412]
MPIELADPELVDTLERVGVRSVYEPLVPFLADATVDLDRTVAIATDVHREGLRSVPSAHAALIITRMTYGAPPTCFEPYVEEGVLGGFIPFSPDVWGVCRHGRLAVRTYQQFPDTVRVALAGRPLRRLIDVPAFANRAYVIDDCVVEGGVTVATCTVETLPVGEAVRRALEMRAAAAPVTASDADVD